MRSHHHKGAQCALPQPPTCRNNLFQPYDNQFYFLEVYPTTLYKYILHVYMDKSLYHQIRLKDFFPPPQPTTIRSDAFLSFSYRYN